jgi:hypothetical protein
MKRILITKSKLTEDQLKSLRSEHKIINENTNNMVIETNDHEAYLVKELYKGLESMDESENLRS